MWQLERSVASRISPFVNFVKIKVGNTVFFLFQVIQYFFYLRKLYGEIKKSQNMANSGIQDVAT